MARLDGESIYRRIAVRMHADEKVLRLTKPQPCGLALWWNLLAGEQTSIIPGLFRIGEAAFAEQLGWDIEGFRQAFKEVEDQGLVKADWKSRLVWVPKAIKHNVPASPNVVLHWRDAWDLLPECDLKEKAKASLKAFLKAYSEPYAKAFDKVTEKKTPKPSGMSSGKASPNQEAGSSKQEEESSKLSTESNSQPPVDNFGLDGLTDADKAQVKRLLSQGRGVDAVELLAALREAQDKTRPEATG
jgi:hypothetical protein